jgi:hypothetical protein
MDQAIQIVGALMVLAGFTGLQMGKISPISRTYLVLNLFGAAILTTLGVIEEQWGFVLLEGVWTIVSAWGLLQVLRGRAPTMAH